MIVAHAQPGTPPPPPRPARIALAHDWLCGYRGGEAVLERLASLIQRRFEPAGVYVMFDDGRPLAPAVDALRARGLVRPSFLNDLPGGPGKLRRWLLPLYPRAVARLGDRLAADHSREPIDLLISTSSAAIKGLRPPPGIPHLCYCHSPARYIWSRREEYGARRGGGIVGGLRGLGLGWYGERFKRWDRATAATITRFVANSRHTAAQIEACFGRESSVVYPPVRTEFFTPVPHPSPRGRENFWLIVSALEPYKRIDLAVEAARLAGARLVVAGDGSQRGVLRRAAGPHAEFLGRVSDETLRDLYRRGSLLLFPQVEDFGIVAAEAMACGLPVVARAEGGALDIVTDRLTGAFFREATAAAIIEATTRVPRECAQACRASAERFAEDRFEREMLTEVTRLLAASAPARS